MFRLRSSCVRGAVRRSALPTPVALVPRRAFAPAQDFIDTNKKVNGYGKPVGRAWRAAELRLKSFDELQTLWYVLLKERNMLLTTREHARADKRMMPGPDRLGKVRLSMKRVRAVVGERSVVYKRLLEYRRLHLAPAAADVAPLPAVEFGADQLAADDETPAADAPPPAGAARAPAERRAQ